MLTVEAVNAHGCGAALLVQAAEPKEASLYRWGGLAMLCVCEPHRWQPCLGWSSASFGKIT